MSYLKEILNITTPLISDREQQVLMLIAHEWTSEEIAMKLHISIHTAISHRKHLLKKFGVRNTAGLVRRGFELGYLEVKSSIRFQSLHELRSRA